VQPENIMTASNLKDRRVQSIRAALSPSFDSLRKGQKSIEDALKKRGEEISCTKAAVSDFKNTLKVSSKAGSGYHESGTK
jgi:hypothetical protein